mgnify:CR=1 FL=1
MAGGDALAMVDTRPLGLDALAVRVCRVVRDLRAEHEAWIAIDRLQHGIGVQHLRTVEAAVAFAHAKGWLAIDGGGRNRVLLKPGAP